jgi:hypothetical protein
MGRDRYLSRLADVGVQDCGFSKPPHQHAGAAVDETFGQTFMQRIGQFVLNCARDTLPMVRIGKPIRAVGNESPSPDMRYPVGESVDVAVGPVGKSNLTSEPIDGDVTLSHQESIEGNGQFGMGRRCNLSIVGNLADIPQSRDSRAVAREGAHILVARSMFQNQYVFANGRAC